MNEKSSTTVLPDENVPPGPAAIGSVSDSIDKAVGTERAISAPGG
jgi:hypothetical protein